MYVNDWLMIVEKERADESAKISLAKERPTEFVITEAWLRRYANGPAGWNADQLETVGVKWPPRKGWLKKLIGVKIPIGMKELFEMRQREPVERVPYRRQADSSPRKADSDGRCWHCQEEAPKLFHEEGSLYCAGCLGRHFAKQLADAARVGVQST